MNKARHAFGNLENLEAAIQNGTVDAYDILFMKDANGKPYIGWIDKDGNKVILEDADLTQLESQVSELETQVETKVDATTVQTMIEEYSKSEIEVVEF